MLPARPPGRPLALSDTKSHVDGIRSRETVNRLQNQCECQALLEFHDKGPLLAADSHDIARADFALHLIALCFKKLLDWTVQVGFGHAAVYPVHTFVSA